LLVLYFGKGELFEWAHIEIKGKGQWLNPHFVYARDIIGIVLLALLAKRVVYHSVRRDIGAIRGGLAGGDRDKRSRWLDKSYDSYMVGWEGETVGEIRKTTDKMGRLSPVVVIVYSLVMTMVAFDQLMSVDPHWFSTLFGVLVFMSAVYVAVAWVSMASGMAREVHPLFRSKVARSTLHDLGKLLFGFGIFWAYMFWSHYLPIWYGNLPEETAWVIVRLRLEPWHRLAWMTLGACFIVPFLIGLSRDVKQMPSLLAGTGAIVAFGIWLQMYLLFVPTLSPMYIPLGIRDILITLGFMGVFLLSCASFLGKVPLIPFGDMLPDEH
jgi:hypothetical protein